MTTTNDIPVRVAPDGALTKQGKLCCPACGTIDRYSHPAFAHASGLRTCGICGVEYRERSTLSNNAELRQLAASLRF